MPRARGKRISRFLGVAGRGSGATKPHLRIGLEYECSPGDVECQRGRALSGALIAGVLALLDPMINIVDPPCLDAPAAGQHALVTEVLADPVRVLLDAFFRKINNSGARPGQAGPWPASAPPA